MKFKRNIKPEYGLQQIDIAPLIDCVFLLLIFFMLSSSFTVQSGIKVKLPRAITSDVIKEENLIILVTGENIFYFENIVSTLAEIKEQLSRPSNRQRAILIKADRRASLGRVIDIWDLCRELGIKKINIATDYEE